MNTFTPGSSAVVVTQVELSISGRNLHDADILSKSDPMVVVCEKPPGNNIWREIGRTEVIWDNLNPDFEKKIFLDYHFEVHQQLRFSCYDIDSKSRNLDDHDFLGTVYCSLGEIVTNQARSQFERELLHKNGKPFKGKIIIRSEEVNPARDFFEFELCISNLPSGIFFSSKYFIEIRRVDETGSFVLVKRTEAQSGKKISIQMNISGSKLNNGDNQRTLQIALFQHKSNGSHRQMGALELNGEDLKIKSSKYTFSKTKVVLQIVKSKVTTKYTFVDYITAGMEMNFVVGIDFTASNGAPSNPQSLHFNQSHMPNQYVQAITAVGSIIQDYDTDKLFPVYGFGARIPPVGQVSHMFPCNFNPENPFVEKVDGILHAYKQCLNQVQLYGPTNFSPIIQECASMARNEAQQNRQYRGFFVLLIVTDGVITDMDATKRAIVENSDLPFSIIIVGVGDANFDRMEELDSDDQLLEWNGRTAVRDIVQFVSFKECVSTDPGQMRSTLAKEVLAEIPEQVTSYMFAKKFLPGNQNNPPPYI